MAIPVLYISYDGMTDPLGQSQVIPYLIGLTKLGYSFTLISCEKTDAYSRDKDKIAELLKENNIDWRPLSYTKSPTILSTLYDIYKIKKLALLLNAEKHFKMVHCRSYIAALVGLQLKEKAGLKFVFDMRGFWADERVDGKLWNLKHIVFKTIYHYFKRKENSFLRNADYTISLTHTAKEELLSWESIPDTTPVKVIPCCVDLELFDNKNIVPERLKLFREELGITLNDKVLLYLGSIGTWYMLEEMMEFFSVLKQQEPGAKFLFVTKDEHERILNCAEKYQVRQDILLRPGARAEIPYLIRLSNYSVFFILPAYSKKASSPTKQGEIMAMGIPVICNAHVGDTDKIIADYQSGIVVEGFNSTAYKDAIKKLDAGFSEEQIIKGAADYFSLENGVVRYAEVYASVLGS